MQNRIKCLAVVVTLLVTPFAFAQPTQPEPSLVIPNGSIDDVVDDVRAFPNVGEVQNAGELGIVAPTNLNEPEPLLRGPVHEAFAEPLQLTLEDLETLQKEPPKPIDEIPPAIEDTTDMTWLPGYWSWDEDRADYIWVSGVWRRSPRGRTWVAGSWTKANDGWRWTAGFWSMPNQTEMQIVPQPPATLEQGPTIAQPSEDHFWIPGSWQYQDSQQYAWRPGFWSQCQENWVWVPEHYVARPDGCIHVAGYWDYNWDDRGTLFAPYYVPSTLYAHSTYRFQPSVVVSFGNMLDHLWIHPRHRHYYYGDYYNDIYSSYGYVPWYSYQNRSRSFYDPLFVYLRWSNRRNLDIYDFYRGRHNYYRANSQFRPSRSFRDYDRQRALNHGQQQTVLARRVEDMLGGRHRDWNKAASHRTLSARSGNGNRNGRNGRNGNERDGRNRNGELNANRGRSNQGDNRLGGGRPGNRQGNQRGDLVRDNNGSNSRGAITEARNGNNATNRPGNRTNRPGARTNDPNVAGNQVRNPRRDQNQVNISSGRSDNLNSRLQNDKAGRLNQRNIVTSPANNGVHRELRRENSQKLQNRLNQLDRDSAVNRRALEQGTTPNRVQAQQRAARAAQQAQRAQSQRGQAQRVQQAPQRVQQAPQRVQQAPQRVQQAPQRVQQQQARQLQAEAQSRNRKRAQQDAVRAQQSRQQQQQRNQDATQQRNRAQRLLNETRARQTPTRSVQRPAISSPPRSVRQSQPRPNVQRNQPRPSVQRSQPQPRVQRQSTSRPSSGRGQSSNRGGGRSGGGGRGGNRGRR